MHKNLLLGLSDIRLIMGILIECKYNFLCKLHKRTTSLKLSLAKGFTLAEVLITLVIIGIVAAMTIPTLINDSQKLQEVTALKKAYAETLIALKTYMANNNCDTLNCTQVFAGTAADVSWYTNMETAMKSVFKITESCNSDDSAKCSKTVNYLGSTAGSTTFFNWGYIFKTIDGFVFEIQDSDAGSCTYNSGASSDAKMKNACGYIIVDINGDAKPDKFGRDVYWFWIGNDGLLYPYGGIEDNKVNALYWGTNQNLCGYNNGTIPATALGLGCSARIMESGWKIDY